MMSAVIKEYFRDPENAKGKRPQGIYYAMYSQEG